VFAPEGGQAFISQNIKLYVLVGTNMFILCALMFFSTLAFCGTGVFVGWIAPPTHRCALGYSNTRTVRPMKEKT
jgi:hypothetical protein